MQGRPAGRIGVAAGPTTGRANGIFRLSEVLIAKKSTGWPVEAGSQSASYVAPALASSPTGQVQYTQVKTDGGTLA